MFGVYGELHLRWTIVNTIHQMSPTGARVIGSADHCIQSLDIDRHIFSRLFHGIRHSGSIPALNSVSSH